MPEVTVNVTRPDLDIQEDIHRLMTDYPPLSHDKHRVHITVDNGLVTISGYTKAPPTRNYLVRSVSQVEGVKSVDSADLYDDETIRLDVARVAPMGVFVNVEYGALILAGGVPEGTTVEELVRQVGRVPGVHRVVTTFN